MGHRAPPPPSQGTSTIPHTAEDTYLTPVTTFGLQNPLARYDDGSHSVGCVIYFNVPRELGPERVGIICGFQAPSEGEKQHHRVFALFSAEGVVSLEVTGCTLLGVGDIVRSVLCR